MFSKRRCKLNASATLVQTRWRCYRCRAVFSALRWGFLYAEAAAQLVERYWLVGRFPKGIVVVPATTAGVNVHVWINFRRFHGLQLS